MENGRPWSRRLEWNGNTSKAIILKLGLHDSSPWFSNSGKKKSVAICDLHKIWQNFRDYAGDQTSAFTLFTMLIGPRQEHHSTTKRSLLLRKSCRKVFNIWSPNMEEMYNTMYLDLLVSDSFLFRIISLKWIVLNPHYCRYKNILSILLKLMLKHVIVQML